MKRFVVALPLFDMNMNVEAYRLEDQSGEKLFGTAMDFQEMGEALISPDIDLVNSIGIEPFTGGKKLFVDVNQSLLILGVPANTDLPPESIVCTLPKDTPAEQAVLQKIQEFKELGFTFALDEMEFSEESKPLFDMTDYVIYNAGDINFRQQMIGMRKQYPAGKKVVISAIPDPETYAMYTNIPDALYEGKFYNQPLSQERGEISAIKANALQLLRMVNEEDDFDFTPVVKIVERDPSISISLLRFINSPAVGVRRKIENISQAVAILGQKELKRWVTIAVSVQLASDRPDEITKLSLVRAKFAENLAKPYNMAMQNSSLFMAGLFSLLDVILEKPMAEAIEEVAVDDRVKEALVNQAGPLYKVLDMVYNYERANWDAVAYNMIRSGVDVELITDAFIEALVWYKQLLEEIDEED